MEKGLFEVLTEICNEKGISQEVLIDALEAALVAAYKKNFYSAQNVEVSIDRESGTVKVFAKKEVVDLVYDEFEEISLEDARAINGNYQIGDMVNIEVTPKDFGRISAMTAKQVVTQRIREAERGIMMEINTKAFLRKGCFFPDIRHFAFIRALGIPVLVNSDAHRPDLINAGRAEALQALKEAGFHTVRQLQGGKWIDVPIA